MKLYATRLCNSCLALCSEYTKSTKGDRGSETFCDICAVTSNIYTHNFYSVTYFMIPDSLTDWRIIIEFIKNKYMRRIFKLI